MSASPHTVFGMLGDDNSVILIMITSNLLKQPGRYVSLNHNIYIAADPTPVEVDQAAHACHRIVRLQCLLSES